MEQHNMHPLCHATVHPLCLRPACLRCTHSSIQGFSGLPTSLFQLLFKGASRLNVTLSVPICMPVLCFGPITATQISYTQLSLSSIKPSISQPVSTSL